MAEGRLPKIALKWKPKQKRARERTMENWMENIRKAMKERNLNKGQWKDRKQWSLGVGQRRKRNVYLPSLRMKVPDHVYVLGHSYTCHTLIKYNRYA
jgi:hypothetical protein